MKYDLFDIIPRASEMALESMSDAFVLIDAGGNLISANETANELFPSILKINRHDSITKIENWPYELSAINAKRIPETIKFTMPDETYYSAAVSPIITGKNRLIGQLILIQNITESVLLTRSLEESAFTDALTGIANRQHFMDLLTPQLDRINRTNSAGYIIIFDIDYFKSVNDTYGHIVGDRVLKETVERIKKAIRPYDLFGRYGGEEFIIFASEIKEADIFELTERLRKSLSDTSVSIDGFELTVTASFGVAQIASYENLEGIIKLADEALYQAKNEGRNRVVLK